MANGNDNPTLADYVTYYARAWRHMFSPDLTDKEKKLLSDFNRKTDPDVSVGKQSSFEYSSAVHYSDIRTVFDAVKEKLGFERKRKPSIFLSSKRFSDEQRERVNKEQALRNIDDVADKEAFILAHELGHEIDYKFGNTIDDRIPVSETRSAETKKIDEILSKIGGDQYDLRQTQKRVDNKQLFADDIGRALLAEQEDRETNKYIDAVQRFTEKVMKDEI